METTIMAKLEGASFHPYITKSLSDAIDDALHFDEISNGDRIAPEFLTALWSDSLMLVRGPNERLVPMMQYLIEQDADYINQFLTHLALPGLVSAPMDVKINLLWYLHVAENPYRTDLSSLEREYISGIPEPALQKLLSARYTGPIDRASLLFALLSGTRAPSPNVADLQPRYSHITEEPLTGVWELAREYGLYNFELNLISEYPPHVQVALQPEEVWEPIYMQVTPRNIDEFVEEYGIVSGRPIGNPIDYLREEIKMYGPVLNRSLDDPPPPMLANPTREQVAATLAIYTLEEIARIYEITVPWSGRHQLISAIYQEQRRPPAWRWSHRFCNNNDTFNLIDVVAHGEMNKDDPSNPTLSYGVIGNYRCYQMEELIESFRMLEDNTFIFGVPDYEPGRIDPTTGTPLRDRFPAASILQLDTLLPETGLAAELKEKIRVGLLAQQAELDLITRLRLQYSHMHSDKQALITLYLVWVFQFGFWMRFWLGPGHPWTVSLDEMRRQAGRRFNYGYMCPLQRDELVGIQHRVYHQLMEQVAKDPVVDEWIRSLPQGLTTRWADEDWHLGSSLSVFIERLTLGACQQGGGKYIPMSGYYLLTRVIPGVDNLDGFNRTVQRYIPSTLKYEVEAIQDRLKLVRELQLTAEQQAILRARLNEIVANPEPIQPPFDPRGMDEVPDTDIPE